MKEITNEAIVLVKWIFKEVFGQIKYWFRKRE